MEEYKIKYNTWLNDPVISEEDKQDLRSIQNDEKEIEEFEIKVFSRVPLNRMMGEKLFVTFSQHDFSVCYLVMKEGR